MKSSGGCLDYTPDGVKGFAEQRAGGDRRDTKGVG